MTNFNNNFAYKGDKLMLLRIFFVISVSIVLESSAADINTMKKEIDSMFCSSNDVQVEKLLLNYCERMDEGQLDILSSLCHHEITEGLKTNNLYLHKIGLIAKSYVNKKIKLNNMALFLEIMSLINDDILLFSKRENDQCIDIKSDLNFLSNYVYLHSLLRDYLPLSYETNDGYQCYQVVKTIIDNSHIYIRKLAASYLMKLINEKKITLTDQDNIVLLVRNVLEKEKLKKNFENIDDVIYKNLQESILNDLEVVLKNIDK